MIFWNILVFLNVRLCLNERLLSLESEPGFLFGTVDSHVSFIKQQKFAHVYVYKRLSTEGHFHINVKSMPGVFMAILPDDTLGYKFLNTGPSNNDGNLNKSLKTPSATHDQMCVFRITKVLDSDDIYIMHDELCLSYNPIRKKFEKRECDEFALEQRFVPISPKDGSRIFDIFPPYETEVRKKLVVEK